MNSVNSTDSTRTATCPNAACDGSPDTALSRRAERADLTAPIRAVADSAAPSLAHLVRLRHVVDAQLRCAGPDVDAQILVHDAAIETLAALRLRSAADTRLQQALRTEEERMRMARVGRSGRADDVYSVRPMADRAAAGNLLLGPPTGWAGWRQLRPPQPR